MEEEGGCGEEGIVGMKKPRRREGRGGTNGQREGEMQLGGCGDAERPRRRAEGSADR